MSSTGPVLVVEDDGIIAEDLRRTLQRLGYVVPRLVGTGEAAVRAALEEPPSIVLMDIQLRGPVDGIEAARRIRERCNSALVYLTSHSDESTLARAMETQPHGYLLKPFEDRELRSTIEVALHKHELETALTQRERWFSTTLESLGDGVIGCDPEGVITFLNPVAESVTGWSRDDALGRRLEEVLRFDADAAQALAPASTDSALDAKPRREASLIRRDGTSLVVEHSVAAIVARSQRLGAVQILRDVTEERALQRRVALAERMASIGTLAAGMGHEINNPLSYVLTNLGIALEDLDAMDADLREGGRSSAQTRLDTVRSELRDALEGSRRILHVVRALGRLGRNAPSDWEPTSVEQALEAALAITAPQVRPVAEVERAFAARSLVLANQSLLVQLFSNLLSNAAAAIERAHRGRGKIRLATESVGEHVAIEITDDGCGIPRDLQERIFDPFFTGGEVGEGLGLGLSICHSIVSSLGGEIVVRSEPGEGTTMRIVLPGTDVARGRRDSAPIPELEASPRRARVLVVDDDLAIGRSFERLLRDEHDVTVCADAQAAMSQLGAAPWDVLFIDVMMPRVGGVDLYDALRAVRPELADRVVFVTGGLVSRQARELMASTGRPLLEKPLSPQRIRALVRATAGLAQQEP